MPSDITTCLVCDLPGFAIKATGSSREFHCTCRRCGQYECTKEFQLFFAGEGEYKDRRHQLSGLIREINEAGDVPALLIKELSMWFQDSRIPADDDIGAKAGKILAYARKKAPFYGARTELDLKKDRSIAYARDGEEFAALLQFLDDEGLADAKVPFADTTAGRIYADTVDIQLSSHGWRVAKDLSARAAETAQGFIAIRFDEDSVPCIQAIEQGIRSAGYEPMCIKEKHYPEKVIDKALAEIRRSRFLVVDLTKNRPAVSYEAGFAAALGIEIIYVRQKGDERIEDFYARHYKYLEYEGREDLARIVEEAVRARIGVPSHAR